MKKNGVRSKLGCALYSHSPACLFLSRLLLPVCQASIVLPAFPLSPSSPRKSFPFREITWVPCVPLSFQSTQCKCEPVREYVPEARQLIYCECPSLFWGEKEPWQDPKAKARFFQHLQQYIWEWNPRGQRTGSCGCSCEEGLVGLKEARGEFLHTT